MDDGPHDAAYNEPVARVRALRLTDDEVDSFEGECGCTCGDDDADGLARAQYDKLLRGLVEILASNEFPDPTSDDILGQWEKDPKIVIGWCGAILLIDGILKRALGDEGL